MAGIVVPTLAFLATACQTTAPPAPTTAPAKVAKLFIMTDLVWGSKNMSDAQRSTVSCTLSSRFPRNGEMVWRTRVFDPFTGDLMDNTTLSSVQVRLANGTNLDMKYGPHPAKTQPQETFWTTSWVIPKTHPTGTLNYSVVATSTDGRTGEFKPFITTVSLPTILEEVLPDAPPTPAPAPAKPKA
jgi:hypothetical protein